MGVCDVIGLGYLTVCTKPDIHVSLVVQLPPEDYLTGRELLREALSGDEGIVPHKDERQKYLGDGVRKVCDTNFPKHRECAPSLPLDPLDKTLDLSYVLNFC